MQSIRHPLFTVWLRSWTKFSLEAKEMNYGSVLDIGWSFESFQMTSTAIAGGPKPH